MSYDIRLFDIIMFCVVFNFKEHIGYYYLFIFSSVILLYFMFYSNNQWYLVIIISLKCNVGVFVFLLFFI